MMKRQSDPPGLPTLTVATTSIGRATLAARSHSPRSELHTHWRHVSQQTSAACITSAPFRTRSRDPAIGDRRDLVAVPERVSDRPYQARPIPRLERRLLLCRVEPEPADASRGRFAADPRRPSMSDGRHHCIREGPTVPRSGTNGARWRSSRRSGTAAIGLALQLCKSSISAVSLSVPLVCPRSRTQKSSSSTTSSLALWTNLSSQLRAGGEALA